MNKLEAIKELESLKTIGNDARAACYNEGINAGITIIKQLDEPQKPVVPKFVADWFEENKDDLDNAIFGYLVFWEERDTDSVLYQWFAKSENNPIENRIRMKDGYEVEKEPLYEVIIGDLYLIKKFNDRNDFCFDTSHSLCTWEKSAYQLTEEEIKAIDERFWAFAVPVEEVVEG